MIRDQGQLIVYAHNSQMKWKVKIWYTACRWQFQLVMLRSRVEGYSAETLGAKCTITAGQQMFFKPGSNVAATKDHNS